MIKKNQLRKQKLETIMNLVNKEIDGDNLKVYTQFIDNKNKLLEQKKMEVLIQIESIRKNTQKIIRNMNEGVKDRLQKKQKIIMEKKSRPNHETAKELSHLFDYMENQANIIMRNSKDIIHFNDACKMMVDELQKQTNIRMKHDHLDREYQILNSECEKEEKIRDALNHQKQAKRHHYSSIMSQIQKYRLEYESVQSQIRDRQRELIHLTSYLQTRQSQDKLTLDKIHETALFLQQQLMKAQNILNYHNNKKQQLGILQIESHNNQ